MAAAKLCMDAAADVPGSSLVTVMSRNGVEFGIRVAGTGDRWYTAPVGPADGLFFPGYGPDDANPDMGDSAITETLGIGGFAMAASPSITTFVGGTPADALAASRSMRRITLAPHPAFPLPPLNFVGSPSGIDVLKVLDTGELPLINTGIAHREAGRRADRRRDRHRPARGVPRGGARPRRAGATGRGGDMIEPGVVLIAIGGNALVHEGESGSLCRQQERSAAFARQVVELVEAGWRVLVTHGNGPQVGFILRRGELVAPDATVEGLPELPLWLAVADSQGGIGHLLCLAIDDALIAHDRPERAVAVLTHVEVDADDPAFGHPTKPIGGLLTADSARRRVAEEGWSVVETAPGVYRRVVPSPAPTAILEAAQVRTLADAGAVVIAAGGGGIPLVSRDGQWAAVDAVVDKDRSSALLAARDRGRHDGAGHRGRRGLRRLRPADPACAARRHRGRDAGPPRRRAVPRGLHGPEGRVRAALRRGRRPPVDHHLARTPAGRTGRQGGHPHPRPP